MTEKTLRALVGKLTNLGEEIEVIEIRLADAKQLKEDVLALVEGEAAVLGIDPYEVKEF